MGVNCTVKECILQISARAFTRIYLQNLASIQPRTSLVKFARSPRTDRPGFGGKGATEEPGFPGAKPNPIPRGDVAGFMVSLVEDNSWDGKAVSVFPRPTK